MYFPTTQAMMPHVGLDAWYHDDAWYYGQIKSFTTAKGYGFIDCPALFFYYNRDVFVHQSKMNGMNVGDFVFFQYKVNGKGMPQAYSLSVPPPEQFSTWPPSLLPPVQVGKVITMAGAEVPVKLIAGETMCSLRKRIAEEWSPGLPAEAVKLVLQGTVLKDEQEVTVGGEDDVVTAVSLMGQYNELVKCAIAKIYAHIKGVKDLEGSLQRVGKIFYQHVDLEAGEVRVQLEVRIIGRNGPENHFVGARYRHDVADGEDQIQFEIRVPWRMV